MHDGGAAPATGRGLPGHLVIPRWWIDTASRLRPQHWAVALACLRGANTRDVEWHHAIEGPVLICRGELVTTADNLAAAAGVTRAVVRRALAHLASLDLVQISVPTSQGFTHIKLSGIDMLFVGPDRERAKGGPRVDSKTIQGSASESVADSGTCEDVVEPTNQGSEAKRASISDLRSPSDQREEHNLRPPTDVSAVPAGSAGKARRVRKATTKAALSPRAYAGADYLRDQILARQPNNALAHRPWPTTRCGACGRSFSGEVLPKHRYGGVDPVPCQGQAIVTSASSANRERWAQQLEEMVRLDHRNWDDVATVIRWLFHEQRGGFRFRVDSPESLRRKWDSIQDTIATAKEKDPKTTGPEMPDRKFNVL